MGLGGRDKEGKEEDVGGEGKRERERERERAPTHFH